MTLEQIIRLAVDAGVSALRALLASFDVTLTDELVDSVRGTVAGILQQGPGVTHAQTLVIDDGR